MRFSLLPGAVCLCVCPDPCVSRDTCALAYLSGSVTHPGAMLLSQSGGGEARAACSQGGARRGFPGAKTVEGEG